MDAGVSPSHGWDDDSEGKLRGMRWALALTVLLCLLLPASASALPPNFSDVAAFSGLVRPTAVSFSPDGRVFVAEQSGLIKVFDGPGDTTPTQVADLRGQTHTFWDRGMLGMALDPQFPARPYIYVSYTYNAEIGGTAPRWDGCPTPPGPTADGCVVSGRLSRLTLNGNVMSNEKVLINDWCQQYPSHSVGDVAFGADGALYMSAGDGAYWGTTDYGQDGNPLNPCGDPPAGVGGTQTIPTAEGGALRSQDMRTSGDPLGLDGSLIRVNPDTGRPIPDLPGETNQSTLNRSRIVAYGFRNPFRIAVRPGTNEVWVGDVGWNSVEEINRVQPGQVRNYGWPCYEGNQKAYDIGLDICDDLYAEGSAVHPWYAWEHGAKVVPSEPCRTDSGSSASGLEFYETSAGRGSYPASYDGALFFTDYPRHCIWVMKKGSGALPDPTSIAVFEQAVAVDLELGPDDSLYYPDIDSGEIRKIVYEPDNVSPVARATATPNQGAVPLQVQLDASGSTDADPGDQLTYAWDLDEDGQFDDSTSATPTRTFTNEGIFHPRVRVSDQTGAHSEAAATVNAGLPPWPQIASPQPDTELAENEVFTFSGSATDVRDGELAPSRLDWSAVLNHCTAAGGCHQHAIQDFDGVAGGELALPAHDRPYYLTLTLTATDSDGLQASTSVNVYPADNEAPVPSIDLPSADAGYSAGQRISFSGSATDREDGTVAAGGLRWRLLCDGGGDCGAGGLSADVGPGGEFLAPAAPESTPLRLRLIATDSEGASASTDVVLKPDTVDLLVDSRRRGAKVSVAGVHGRTPFSQPVLRRSTVRVSTPRRQHAAGHGRRAKLKWTRWSDRGERVHTVAPSRDRTLRVSYRLVRRSRR